jgi:hypothetical protein
LPMPMGHKLMRHEHEQRDIHMTVSWEVVVIAQFGA